MSPYHNSDGVTLYHGDCLDVLRQMPEASVDAVVTDPPYGLSFMGKKWDYDVPSVDVWAECLRVLKPGGHLLAFAGTRTQHRMAVRIEDAGFEIRDMLAWVYGSGFPKSMDVSKAIDKMDANETIDAAQKWDGWGTALKPAMEPITMARKPLVGTVAWNVQVHGTGAINVDGCRIGEELLSAQRRGVSLIGTFDGADGNIKPDRVGRWPANFIHDCGDEVDALLGDATRFFYCAKTSKADRDEGCRAMPVCQTVGGGGLGNPVSGAYGSEKAPARNHHPTVKPTDLMRYLCRLVTPPGGVVFDPFAGSGSTLKAARLEGFRAIGIEREAEYCAIAAARAAAAVPALQGSLL